MRYMMLIYSTEPADGLPSEEVERMWFRHRSVLDEAARKGILISAEPLASTTTATTVRMQGGKALLTDGPFTETEQRLTGYYIIECENLDEAIDWAAKIPTACGGEEGPIEIRPIPDVGYAAGTRRKGAGNFDIE